MKKSKNNIFYSIAYLLVMLITGCTTTQSNDSKPVPNGYYRIKSGDTLYRIGLRYNLSVNTLSAWNNISNPSNIKVGQLIRVKKNATTTNTRISKTQNSNAYSHSNNPNTIQIKLIWPVSNGKSRVITQFNANTNKGIDIKGQLNEPIKAAANGKVIYVGEGIRGYGKLILINHDHNAITAYAHNNSIKVVNGENVKAGQTIALMGNSDADQVKLHFELRVNSKAINPLPYIK